MGASAITCIESCGTWPHAVNSIKLMLLDGRIDAFSIEWIDKISMSRLESFHSVISIDEFNELTGVLARRMSAFNNFKLCKGSDIYTDTGILRVVKVIAS